MKWLISVSLALSLAGCAMVPPFEKPSADELAGPRDFIGTIGAPKGPRVPQGILGPHIGQYVTIEGKKHIGTFVGESCLLVDTVNGNKLADPIAITIQNLILPTNSRCVLKGYETGHMAGTTPAEVDAGIEQGKSPQVTQACWDGTQSLLS